MANKFGGSREKLFRKFNGRCSYCGGAIDLDYFHADHFIPKSKGGSNGVKNRMPACAPCNSKKRDYTISELRSRILSQAPVFNVLFYFEHMGYNEAELGELETMEVYNG
jgi:hypothetical protein